MSLSSKSVELPSIIKASLFPLRLIGVMTHLDSLTGQARCVQPSILNAGNVATCAVVPLPGLGLQQTAVDPRHLQETGTGIDQDIDQMTSVVFLKYEPQNHQTML